MKQFLITITCVLFCIAVSDARCAESDRSEVNGASSSEVSAVTGVRRALIICGHPGDDEHRELFAATVERMQTALVDRYGFDADAVWVLFGGEEPAPVDPVIESPHGASTQESLARTMDELREEIGPDDALWVVALGHVHYDGRHAWYNLPGPDLHEQTFAALFSGIACREQVFWITIPASGFYIQPLSAPGRIIISATAADRELNETVFPHVLATVLSTDLQAESMEPASETTEPAEEPEDSAEEPAGETSVPAEPDAEISAPQVDSAEGDAGGEAASAPVVQTLLDLYLAVTRRVAEQFAGDMQIPTEHALLEANGDGRGAEVQYDHLPEELGGRLQEGESPPEPLPNSDAAAAQAVVLPLQTERAEPAGAAESEAGADGASPATSPPADEPAESPSDSEPVAEDAP